MNHNDGERCVCSECGSEFHFTTAEQRFYEERGLNFPPKRCKTCRLARKAAGPARGAPPGRDSGGFRGPPGRDSRDSGGFRGPPGRDARDSGGFRGPPGRDGGFQGPPGRDAGGFRGPAGYGGAPRGDDRRGPPPRFGQGAPPQRDGGFAPRAPRFGDDRGGFRARSSFDAPPPAAYGHERAPQRPRETRETREPAEPRKARVAREKPKFDITCQQCGTHATVPFKPLPGRDIFCPDCYRARKGLSPEERAATSIATRSDARDERATTPGSEPEADVAVSAAPAVEQGPPHEE